MRVAQCDHVHTVCIHIRIMYTCHVSVVYVEPELAFCSPTPSASWQPLVEQSQWYAFA